MYTFESYINTPLEIEKELLNIFNREDPLTIFDIGACEGEESIKYANLFPNSKVFAFEPRPDNINKIRENFRKYNKNSIAIIQEALSENIGTAVFHLSSGSPKGKHDEKWDYGNKSSSLLPPGTEMKKYYNWLNFDEKIEVKTNTIKNFCREHNIENIDFIHLDVQGAELMVLKGASDFIRQIKAIWMEVESVSLYKDQPLKREVEGFMKSNGFIKIVDTVGQIAGDHFYINKSFFPQSIIENSNTAVSLFDFKHKIKARLKGVIGFKKSYPGDSFKKSSFSQSGEDIIIKYIFDNIGIARPSYLDIGAHHPFLFSNTALFYENGSRGINIEPDPQLFIEFKKYRDNDINLNIGISDKQGELDFYIMAASYLNTFSKNEAEKYANDQNIQVTEVKKIKVNTVSYILEKYSNSKFPDFLTLDVEGLDEQILYSIDYSQETPTVICVETISYSNKGDGEKNYAIIQFLESKDYIVYADTNINTIFVKKNKWIRN